LELNQQKRFRGQSTQQILHSGTAVLYSTLMSADMRCWYGSSENGSLAVCDSILSEWSALSRLKTLASAGILCTTLATSATRKLLHLAFISSTLLLKSFALSCFVKCSTSDGNFTQKSTRFNGRRVPVLSYTLLHAQRVILSWELSH